ncbi:hypothetical protein [Polycladidibacter hongkongensis]|uniref:hypothetical protein n=1 Tax=Polycladidibacter hongkongensis TaxID=1647556 RepID=UPI00083433F8|nr:hypothetical protein [Pseudovibrio hongkongensis]
MPLAENAPRFAMVPSAAVLDPDLSPRDLQVLTLLCVSKNRQTGLVYRSQVKMAAQLRVRRSTVQLALKRLIARGWVMIARRGVRSDGACCSHTYRVLDAPEGEGEEEGDDLVQTAQVEAQAEELENRHQDYKNRQGLPAAAGTYKNRISKTIDDDGKAAASRANGASAVPKPPAAVGVAEGASSEGAGARSEGAGARFVAACAALLNSARIGLHTAQMIGGLEPAWGWYMAGADLERDVKPSICKLMLRAKTEISSLNYFSRAIMSAKRAREEQAKNGMDPRYLQSGVEAAARRGRALQREHESCLDAIRAVFGEDALEGAAREAGAGVGAGARR